MCQFKFILKSNINRIKHMYLYEAGRFLYCFHHVL